MTQPFSIQDWLDARAPLRKTFLERFGWGDAQIKPVGEDSAFRRYFRLSQGDKTAILMEAVPDGTAIATPGHRIVDFLRIGTWLKEQGLNSPTVYEADEATGYLLLEDFGSTPFKNALSQGKVADIYGLGVDVLAHLRDSQNTLDLPSYYDSHVHTGRRRVVDWYVPALRQEKVRDGLVEDYLAVWDSIEASLPPCPQGFLHIDYHVENLMWLPERSGLQACGILDFQGAMTGPIPYDLANLLEDARQDVDPELRAALLSRFTSGLSSSDKELFENWYRILATQFHCRVIGQFIRLALVAGKPRYLAFIPRLNGYLAEGLKSPILAPLKEWFDREGIDFTAIPAVDPQKTALFIRDDAF